LNGINAHVDNGMFPFSMGFSPVSTPVQGSQPGSAAPSPQGQLSTDAYQSVKDFIKKQEGFAKKAAWDHKQFTNGYGTEAKAPDEIISRQEADKRLDNYLLPTVQKIQSKLQVPVNNGQLTALSSMAYNGGYGIVRKLINQINKGTSADQVAELIKKTAITVDNGARVLDDLVVRRKKEAGLYTRGYKVGGQYDLGQQEIQHLMNQGYELEFM
jgi:GH24 family phage-related lysozyme (muramidase)